MDNLMLEKEEDKSLSMNKYLRNNDSRFMFKSDSKNKKSYNKIINNFSSNESCPMSCQHKNTSRIRKSLNKKIKEQIEENNRILSLQSYLVGKKIAKPQFYGSKENILKLFDYYIKNNPLYIKEYDRLNNQQKKAFIFSNTADKYLLFL